MFTLLHPKLVINQDIDLDKAALKILQFFYVHVDFYCKNRHKNKFNAKTFQQ